MKNNSNPKKNLFEMMKKVNPDFIIKEDTTRSSYSSDMINDIKTLMGTTGTLSDKEIEQIATSYNTDAQEVQQTIDFVNKSQQGEEQEQFSKAAQEVNDFFKFLENNPQKGSGANVQYFSTLNSKLAKPKSNPMANRFIKLTEYSFRWEESYKNKVARVNPDWELQQRKGGYTKMEGGYGNVMERDRRGDEVLPISPDAMYSIVLVLDESGGVADMVKTRELKEKYAQYFQPSFLKPYEPTGSGVDFRPLKLYSINRIAAGGKVWMNPDLKSMFEPYRDYFSKIDKTIKESINEGFFDDFSDAESQLGEYHVWFNPTESKIYKDDEGETFRKTYVLDVPKKECPQNLLDDLKSEYEGDSHGVEGNPGGWVYHGRVGQKNMGDFYRIYITQESIFDI
jgi:hypothetical protein